MTQVKERTKIATSLLVTFAVFSITAGLGNCSQTAVNALLNGISADMGVSVATSQWLSTGYILAFGVFVPLAPFLIKRFSERFMILLSLSAIAIGSLLIVLVPVFEVALFARILQAAGAGLTMPAMQTMVMVDLPRDRMGFFMGINGIALGFMVNIGPSISGALAEAFGWRSFFWFIFICMVLLVAPTIKYARATGGSINEKFDFPSFLICGFGFVGLLLGFSNASRMGFATPLVWLPLLVGAVLLALFVRREKRMDDPMVNMSIFANAQYRWGFIGMCILFASFVGIMLVIPLYVQDLRGGSALDAGLVVLPASLVALVGNLGAGVLVDRIGARKVLIASTAILLLGAVLAVPCDETTPLWYLALTQVIRGLGISASIGPFVGWSLADLPKRVVSDGSSFLTVGRQAAASLGTSLMVLLILVFSPDGPVAFAYQAAFAFAAVLSVFTLVLAIWKVR
ncbi:MAG: MFS transporter [Eggerthellales bacterium]|nr:MFS transporter [Eggerthellales bacterium]